MALFDAIRNHPSFSSAVGGAVVGAGAVALAGGVKRRLSKASKKKTPTTKRKTTSTRKTKRKTPTSFKKRRTKALRGAKPKKIFKTINPGGPKTDN